MRSCFLVFVCFAAPEAVAKHRGGYAAKRTVSREGKSEPNISGVLKADLKGIHQKNEQYTQELEQLTQEQQQLVEKIEGIDEGVKELRSLWQSSEKQPIPSINPPALRKTKKESDLVGIADLDIGDETFFAGPSDDASTKKRGAHWDFGSGVGRKPVSWNQWMRDITTRPASKPRVHFFTQLDYADQEFVAQTACRVSKLMGDYGGNLFVHGLNSSDVHHDGTKCDDCNYNPKLRQADSGMQPTDREDSNPTGE
jgi:hypothetical protein